MNIIIHLCFLSCIGMCLGASLPAGKLINGPMIGHTTFNDVTLWLQTDVSSKITLHCNSHTHNQDNAIRVSMHTPAAAPHIGKIQISQLKPNTTYTYQLWVDNEPVTPQYPPGSTQTGSIPLTFTTKTKWRHVGDGKQPPDFRIALGSCAYINQEGHLWEDTSSPGYGGDYHIFASIDATAPDIMLWLGDNIYLSEKDFQNPRTIHNRYTFNRQIPELRALFASAIHYAIWDDHDYGPNNAGREFWNKENTRNAFKQFWANPPYPSTEATYTFFNWGDANFYLLDNRWFRTQGGVRTSDKHFLGQKQLDWLIESMKANQTQSGFVYRSTFNIIACGSQVLSDNPNSENYRTYKREWAELIRRIGEERIQNVIFLSGDAHFAEVSKDTFTDSRGRPFTLYDITCSPLTSGVHTGEKKNSTRIAGPIEHRNFMTLDFNGPLQQRMITIRVYNSNGDLMNQKAHAEEGEVDEIWRIRAQ